jgi:isochorismate synthase/2-succinyl-5-enolpyruvyl-6-hydroxy-3-cyclohexene-1-carboxylate synthase/2-succinyl-6-hydroxy-2,4-cyclohexadiene-1-carboxylate synthase/O-succinylbenzoate synthase
MFGSLDEASGAGGSGGGGAGGRALPSDAASGLCAVVIKPTAVGGFEAAWRIAEWAAAGGAAPVVSCAFESSVGLAALAQLAAAADAALAPSGGGAAAAAPAGGSFHGLGTLEWFAADTVAPGLGALSAEAGAGGELAFSVAAADRLLAGAADAAAAAAAAAAGASTDGATSSPGAGAVHLLDVACDEPQLVERRLELQLPRSCPGAAASALCLEARPPPGAPARRPVVLLHGFMGDASDWAPTMRALAAGGHPCLAVDLPGHGGTRPPGGGAAAGNGAAGFYSLDAAAELAAAAAAAAFGAGAECALVGYSMGARVALHALAAAGGGGGGGGAAAGPVWAGAAVVSGTPGIPNPEQRADRTARDAELAGALRAQGLAQFVDWWYRQPLWASLRAHPRFAETAGKRAAAGDAGELASALEGMSTGRMVGAAGGRVAGGERRARGPLDDCSGSLQQPRNPPPAPDPAPAPGPPSPHAGATLGPPARRARAAAACGGRA